MGESDSSGPMFQCRNDAPARLHSTGDVSTGDVEIKIIHEEKDLLVFDMINCDAPMANAFRRIMLAEVPTIAIETVAIEMNSSIIQDEVLAHRLGLVPINVDPETLNEEETLKFRLDFKCKNKKQSNVYSKDLKWLPQDDQESRLSPAPATIHDDIVIAKLAPGQEIVLEMTCMKGVGKDHAKFSPVCTATYRAMPQVEIVRENFSNTSEEDDQILVKSCPMGVFDIEDIGGKQRAVVSNPRKCTMCRECIRAPGWDKKVTLLRKANHFVFSIESVGALAPAEIFTRSLDILRQKCETLLGELEQQ